MALLSLLSCVASSSLVSSTSCDTDFDDRFYFEVFRFPGQTTGDEVYLKATVIVCLSDNGDSVCQDECSACDNNDGSRKRRDTREEIQQTKFYLAAGPFKIREPNQGLWLNNSCARLSKGYQVDRMILRISEIGTPMVKVWGVGEGTVFYGLDRSARYSFERVLSKIGNRFWPFWSEIGCFSLWHGIGSEGTISSFFNTSKFADCLCLWQSILVSYDHQSRVRSLEVWNVVSIFGSGLK